MSSQEKNLNSQKKHLLNQNNENIINSSQNNNDDEKSDNNQLIRPVPITAKLIKKPRSDLTTIANSSINLQNINQDPNIPIIYPQVQLYGIPQSSLEDNNQYGYFSSKSFEFTPKSENIDYSFQKDNKPCCSCTKTKCIKKYCECFANNRLCKDCLCHDCMNNFNYMNKDNNNIKYISENDTINCTCTKSNCNKKYCECFKAGKKCNDKCRCLNCMNSSSPSHISNIINNDNNKKNKNKKYDNSNNTNNSIKNTNNISLDEIKSISAKSSLSENSNNSFKIQRISVFINKNQTLINVEKCSKEDMKLLSKKRKFNRNNLNKK